MGCCYQFIHWNYSCLFSFLRRSAPFFACSLDAQCSLFYVFELTEKAITNLENGSVPAMKNLNISSISLR